LSLILFLICHISSQNNSKKKVKEGKEEKMKRKIIGICICMLLITTCIIPVMGELITVKKSSNEIKSLSSDTTRLKFMIAGKAIRALHTYWLHIPLSYDGSKAVPLVIVFHGSENYNSSDPLLKYRFSWIENYTEFSKKADEEGFIVVYANAKLWIYDPLVTAIFGIEKIYDYNMGWIPSIGKGWKYVDDIGFIDDLIHKMEQKYNINASRVYATGLSAGAFFSYSVGAYLSNEIAAIAPVAGTIGGRANESDPYSYIPDPENPVSVIAFHSTIDQNVPYNGNKNLVSVKASIAFWVEHNGCDPIPDINASESGKVNRTTYTNGENGTEVVLYTFKYGGHIWPGNPLWDPVKEISATDLIWEFFESHPKQ
jgi:polyhydroxybutyrate depolymerase